MTVLHTSRLSLPYPNSAENVDVPADMQALAEALDHVAQVETGVFASRPAFGVIGRYYLATDTLSLYLDTGSAWVEITPGAMPAARALVWGGDTTVHRIGAGVLKLDGYWYTAGEVAARVGQAMQVQIGTIGGAAGVLFGSAGDARITRVAADKLATPGSFDTLNAPLAIVTSLPGSPVDGQQVLFHDATNNVVWHLRYRSSASGSYKWDVLGGSPVHADVDTDQTATAGAYADLSTVGPAVTVPLAGDYLASFGVRRVIATASPSTAGKVSVKKGSAAATDADGLRWEFQPYTPSDAIMPGNARDTVLSGASAGDVIKLVYWAVNANITFGGRWLTVRPLRVG